MNLGLIADKLQIQLSGNRNEEITSLADLNRLPEHSQPESGKLYYFEKKNKLSRKIEEFTRGNFLADTDAQNPQLNILQTDFSNLKIKFIELLSLFEKKSILTKDHLNKSEESRSRFIDQSVVVYPGAIIMDDAIIAENVTIYPNAVIETGAIIGKGSIIKSGAIIGHHCVIGGNCIIYENSVIGSDGFGHHDQNGIRYKIPQIGNVILGDHVEIGACTTIDRATIESTYIGDYTKIDNQVQIAHNCQVGKYVYIAGKASMAGSVTVGDFSILAGGCGIADHINIAPKTVILAFTGIQEDTKEGVVYFGIPARPVREMHKIISSWGQLPDALKRLKLLEKEFNGSNSGH